ncbi:unnamed protein product [Brassicogethes aeneus]|uniref:Uncharacterized protein n=1 Tax=Brassicogethes aeneus TaxID=1431903 RepID=A0A9P0AT69_BRAAE|nr:unnamed protein product [Brassicogethes aeneus]
MMKQPTQENLKNFKSQFDSGLEKNYYYATEALGPHFRSQLLNDVLNEYFCLQYDETTNTGKFKELQVSIRFWSRKEQQIVTNHLETLFLGSATGDILMKYLMEAITNAELPLSNVSIRWTKRKQESL